MHKRAITMLVLVSVAASCARRERVAVHDLVAAAPFAEIHSAWVSLRPGTLETELLEERGFERAAGFGTDDLCAPCRSV